MANWKNIFGYRCDVALNWNGQGKHCVLVVHAKNRRHAVKLAKWALKSVGLKGTYYCYNYKHDYDHVGSVDSVYLMKKTYRKRRRRR